QGGFRGDSRHHPGGDIHAGRRADDRPRVFQDGTGDAAEHSPGRDGHRPARRGAGAGLRPARRIRAHAARRADRRDVRLAARARVPRDERDRDARRSHDDGRGAAAGPGRRDGQRRPAPSRQAPAPPHRLNRPATNPSEDCDMTRNTLKARLAQPGLICAPGIFDGISARIADTMGFDALYMTGYGTVASHLGLPDAGLATYSDMVGRVASFAGACRTPIIADGDTGYGGLLNVDHTVRGYEKAGAAAIQLEDQEFPKKCGHTP